MRGRGRFSAVHGARWVFIGGLLLFSALAAYLGLGSPEDRLFSAGRERPSQGFSMPGAVAGADMGMVLLDIQTQQAAVIYHVPGRGVYVLAVEKGSPADRADVRPGDCILRVNGLEITNAAEVTQALGKLQSGEEAELTVRRGLGSLVLPISADWAMEQL